MKSLLRQAFFPPSQYHRISAGYLDNLFKKHIFWECLAFNSPLRGCNRLGVGGVPITSTPWLCFGWTLTSEPKGCLFQEQLILRAIPSHTIPLFLSTLVNLYRQASMCFKVGGGKGMVGTLHPQLCRPAAPSQKTRPLCY